MGYKSINSPHNSLFIQKLDASILNNLYLKYDTSTNKCFNHSKIIQAFMTVEEQIAILNSQIDFLETLSLNKTSTLSNYLDTMQTNILKFGTEQHTLSFAQIKNEYKQEKLISRFSDTYIDLLYINIFKQFMNDLIQYKKMHKNQNKKSKTSIAMPKLKRKSMLIWLLLFMILITCAITMAYYFKFFTL